jgi:hypothetical protein
VKVLWGISVKKNKRRRLTAEWRANRGREGGEEGERKRDTSREREK